LWTLLNRPLRLDPIEQAGPLHCNPFRTPVPSCMEASEGYAEEPGSRRNGIMVSVQWNVPAGSGHARMMKPYLTLGWPRFVCGAVRASPFPHPVYHPVQDAKMYRASAAAAPSGCRLRRRRRSDNGAGGGRDTGPQIGALLGDRAGDGRALHLTLGVHNHA
jgi:hypothetical protein